MVEAPDEGAGKGWMGGSGSFIRKAQSGTDGSSDVQLDLRKVGEEWNLTEWSVPSGSSRSNCSQNSMDRVREAAMAELWGDITWL